MKEIAYQSIDYTYPTIGWWSGVWYNTKEEHKILIFPLFMKVFRKSAISYARHYIKELNKDSFNADEKYLLLMKLELTGTYPFKKEYWENPSFDLPQIERMMNFVSAVNKPENYSILVTPSYGIELRHPQFTPSFAYTEEEIDKLELFMQTSTHPVIPEAKAGGIYKIKDLYTYDLRNNKIVEIPGEKAN